MKYLFPLLFVCTTFFAACKKEQAISEECDKYIDATKYSVKKGAVYFSYPHLNNQGQILEYDVIGSHVELYDENFNLVNPNFIDHVFLNDTTYRIRGINNNNSFCGDFEDGAFVVINNQRTNFSPPGCFICSAELINDNNLVVGRVNSQDHLFFYHDGVIDTFSVPFPDEALSFIDINNSFALLDHISIHDLVPHYFKLYFDKRIEPLDFDSSFNFMATNNSGTIVGYVNDIHGTLHCTTPPNIRSYTTMGVILNPDNTFISVAVQNTLNALFLDINDHGDILGYTLRVGADSSFILKKR